MRTLLSQQAEHVIPAQKLPTAKKSLNIEPRTEDCFKIYQSKIFLGLRTFTLNYNSSRVHRVVFDDTVDTLTAVGPDVEVAVAFPPLVELLTPPSHHS
jgi:hypothetical protein